MGCVSTPAELLVGLEGAEVWLGVVSLSSRTFCPCRTVHRKELNSLDGASLYAISP